MKKTEEMTESRRYAKPRLTRYKLPFTGIESYQQPSGTRNAINCRSGRCTGGGASTPDLPPWLVP